MYLRDEDDKPIPETLVRPMTRHLFPHGGLDNDVPVFRCPADTGLEYWPRAQRGDWVLQGLSRQSIYATTGNSYYLNLVKGDDSFAHQWRQQKKHRSSAIVLMTEAIMYYDAQFYSPAFEWMPDLERIRQLGWHGQERTYTMLFLDSHAEMKYFRRLYNNTARGDGWVMVKYPYLMDFYR
jgi:hypothetical protein